MPGTGLEPVWLSPHAPQTCVSTSSTTPADDVIVIIAQARLSVKQILKILVENPEIISYPNLPAIDKVNA